MDAVGGRSKTLTNIIGWFASGWGTAMQYSILSIGIYGGFISGSFLFFYVSCCISLLIGGIAIIAPNAHLRRLLGHLSDDLGSMPKRFEKK